MFSVQTNTHLSTCKTTKCVDRQLRAIVVDDEEDLVSVLSDYLRIIDVDVVGTGKDGREAVDLYEMHSPDLVFVDLMMPGYDGLHAIRGIREKDPQSRVIVITAFMHTNTARDLLPLRPNKIISKPWDLNQIYDVVEQFRRATRASAAL